MQATGYLDTRHRHPVALVAAISLNLAAVGVMLAYHPEVFDKRPDAIKLTKFAPEPPPPPKPLERIKTQQPKAADPLPQPQPIPIDPIQRIEPIDTYQPAWPPMPQPPMPGNGTDTAPSAPADPVIVTARIDDRYAQELQPPYPVGLERQEIEGKATVRVQVGTDGRVLAVELVSADDPGFFAATREQALKRWRFKPATRDGQPIVSWVTKTVVFKINRL